MPGKARFTVEERFWAAVKNLGAAPDACWEWSGARTAAGYGVLHVHGRLELAHRLSLSIAGQDPAGWTVRHRCDNPACVNPAHLFLGTAAENVADKHAKGREARGEMVPNARLTEEDARSIRRWHAEGETHRAIAERLGVSRPTVSAVIRGETWKHVEES